MVKLYETGSSIIQNYSIYLKRYVMDEFGSSIRHNDNPTVRCAPFYFMATGVMFSVIWPVKDLEFGGLE